MKENSIKALAPFKIFLPLGVKCDSSILAVLISREVVSHSPT